MTKIVCRGICVVFALLAPPVLANDINVSAAYPVWNVQVDGGPVQSNAPLVLIRGETYNFHVSGLGGPIPHSFYINTANGIGSANAYNGGGLSDNGITTDTPANSPITFDVPQDAPDTLYYNCGFHSSMAGVITVDGVFRNGFDQ